MFKLLWDKVKESLMSILPITVIVLILNFTPLLNLTTYELIVFLVCAVFLIIGTGLFSLGADLAMQPMGDQVGASLMKTKKLKIIILVCFVMGLLLTIAEPDLSVLASQVSDVIDPTILTICVGVGVGIFLVLSILKIIFKLDLSYLLLLFYLIMFAVTCLVIIVGNEGYLPLAYDSGGITTGALTVPFIMALGAGVASSVGGKDSSENSFGLIALCSIGPILAVLILGLASSGDLVYESTSYEIAENFFAAFGSNLVSVAKEVSIALILIVAFFLIIEFIYIKLPKRRLIQTFVGIIYTFLGLVIFLTAVNVGFMPIGYKMGQELANYSNIAILIFSFIIGLVVIIAEPAVHVLNKQVEEITNGGITKWQMLIALAIGVALALFLSILRIIYDFSILYYIVPGYVISLALALFVPKIYTGIAFDSGGVASGTLASCFILPFAIGACIVYQGESAVLTDAFGILAMVALAPLITIQLLGFKDILAKRVQKKVRIKKIDTASDSQIIYFRRDDK